MKPHKCPVCNGHGTVSKPPYVAGDIYAWMGGSTSDLFPCNACSGSGIVWEPDHEPAPVDLGSGYLRVDNGSCDHDYEYYTDTIGTHMVCKKCRARVSVTYTTNSRLSTRSANMKLKRQRENNIRRYGG